LEQIVLYLAVLAALSGFGMGLMNLAGPYLKRRKIALPKLSLAALLNRGSDETDDDLDFDDEDELDAARDFAERSFAADNSLLARRRTVAIDDEEELDEELAGVLDQVAVEELTTEEDANEDEEDEEPRFYTVSAEANGDEPGEDRLDGSLDEEDENDGEYEDEEDEEEPSQPEVHVVAAGGDAGDNMMSFFDEAADAVAKAHLAWRDDLPEVSIEDLLAEARSISQQIKGKKRNAA
jgi:hypothetical protein